MFDLKHCVGAAALVGAALSAEACTSWAIHRSGTETGRMIVQKCRDSFRGRLDADIRVAPNGWRWMRIGSNKHYPNFGMNEKGVAITMNDGDKTEVKHPGGGRVAMAAALTIRYVATHCATAAEGVEFIKQVGRCGWKLGSNATYFIADPHRAFMVDLAHGYAEVKELTGGMIVITNTWHLPGGEEISEKTLSFGKGDRSREANTRAALKKARKNGKYTRRGCFDVSRMKRVKGNPSTLYPFVVGPKVLSLGCSCFELDAEFPAYLSYAYLALGPQQDTIFVPVPMSLDKLPEKFADGSWAQMSYDILDAWGMDHPDMPKFAELEDKFLAEVDKVRAEAYTLLKAGKNEEARKLLNDCFARQFAEADALLTRVSEAAKAKKAAAPAEAAAK